MTCAFDVHPNVVPGVPDPGVYEGGDVEYDVRAVHCAAKGLGLCHVADDRLEVGGDRKAGSLRIEDEGSHAPA